MRDTAARLRAQRSIPRNCKLGDVRDRTLGTACAMRSSSMRSSTFSCLKSAADVLPTTPPASPVPSPSSSSEARASQHLFAYTGHAHGRRNWRTTAAARTSSMQAAKFDAERSNDAESAQMPSCGTMH